MELREYIKNLNEFETMCINSAFNDKNYEKANHKFQQCYKIANNLTKITTPKMYRTVIEFEVLPAQYAEAILDIATKLKPVNKAHYDMLKKYLVQIYILRLKKLVKADNVDLLLCTKEKHLKMYNDLKVRVIDYTEILDIIYGLGLESEEFNQGYKGNSKIKLAINKVYQFLYNGKSKKLEKIKEKTFHDITESIYVNLEALDFKVGLQ